MSGDAKPLNIYFVVGEESGDILGANLMNTLHELHPQLSFHGLAGPRMQKAGMESLFDISEISIMGISAVVSRLPRLLGLIRRTARDIVNTRPDVLVLIDSPEFAYRVAEKAKKQLPDMKVIKYVAPSVWAWRPGRASKIRPYVDHILAVLPFEPEILRSLDGPQATYVGHPLAASIPGIESKSKRDCGAPPNLVALPGSRKGEIKRLMPVIADTLQILRDRGGEYRITLPAVDKLADEISENARNWAFKPNIVTGDEARQAAFRDADIALAASGTVTLELALFKVPTISIYKLDALAMRLRFLLTGWTASLPNLIADYPVVPEKFNEYAHPEYIARMVERLCQDGHERRLQLEGFDVVENRLRQESPSHELAARKILEIAGVPVA